ncbi:hypothetical protein G6F59_015643 [Rhizopus arrhizus]|nr:hypothetical protein G6F59_015643 [Rhizopus arrhizus]
MVRVGLDHPGLAAEPGVANPAGFALHRGRRRTLVPDAFGLVPLIDGVARGLEHGFSPDIARIRRRRGDRRHVRRNAEGG